MSKNNKINQLDQFKTRLIINGFRDHLARRFMNGVSTENIEHVTELRESNES